MTDSDNQLVDRIRGGDATALAAYIEQNRSQLLAFIAKNLGDALRRKVEPEDVLQEVSASCLNSLKDVDLSTREPFSWLCQVSERRIIDSHRRHFTAQKRSAQREVSIGSPAGGNSQAGLVNVLMASITSPSMAVRRDESEAQLMQAMSNLPKEQQDALQLRFGDGLSSREIAERLGKSDVAVRAMLSRTLKHLERELSALEPDS